MNFHKVMSFDLRMKNLSHLTVNKKIINVISNEYSKHFAVQSDAVIFEKICFYTDDFQKRLRRKKLLKKKLKFWKN
jgi:hypothetical protein